MKNGFLVFIVFVNSGCESIKKAQQERLEKIGHQLSDYCWKAYGFKGRYEVQRCDREWENLLNLS